MENHKISIIVPVYNTQKYLPKCLDSVIHQTYQNLEIIIVDDGSNDNSSQIIEEYAQKDNRIKAIHTEHQGVSNARNLGIHASTGEYIAFVDSDDWVVKEYCEILYTNLIQSSADVSAVKFSMVIDNHSVIKNVTPPKEVLDKEIVILEDKEIMKQLLSEKIIDSNVFGKMYPRQIIENQQFTVGQNFDHISFNFDVFSKIQRLVYVDKECYFHLKHEESISATCSENNIQDYIDATLYRFHKANLIEELNPYNYYALLRETTAICIKYVIANFYMEGIEKQLSNIFDMFNEYTADHEQELLPLMNDFQKTSMFLIRYNYKLFFDLLSARHNIKWKRKFGDNVKNKPKILLVCDVPNWAFDKIAQLVKKQLDKKFNIKIEYFNRRTEKDFLFEFIEENKDCDLVHFFNRRILLLMDSEEFKEKVKSHGYQYDEYVASLKSKFTCGVCDFLNIDEESVQEYQNIYNKFTKMYYTTASKLFDIYASIDAYKKPDAIVHDMCDKTLFPPTHLERFDEANITNRDLVIGWVGNGVHSGSTEIDIKGFNTVLKPVVQELIDEGYHIQGHYADRNDKWRTTEEMAEYYSEIDVCVCASTSEGTPLPVLESMYSGIPIISTDVGIVGEAFGEKQKEFIIGSREEGKNDEEVKKLLKEKIIYLYQHREILKELSKENMESIEKFDGGKTIQAFERFFNEALKNKMVII